MQMRLPFRQRANVRQSDFWKVLSGMYVLMACPEFKVAEERAYPVYPSESSRNRDIRIYSRWQASSRFRLNNS